GYFAWGNESWELDFTKLRHPYSFQVVRAEFDQLLLEHAKSQGVKVYEGTEIRGLTFDGERPCSAIWAQGPGDTNTGEISFDTLVDASGRAGIMGMRYLKNRHYHDAFQNVAIWGYWQGADRMSYKISGPGYFMVGDAACFIDPLLSTGVHLATHGSLLAAASIASMYRGEVTEAQALHFYEHSYRHAYLRLMVIVSGLYMQYRGKANYFWQAQQLTHNDYSDAEALNEAFLFVVSGIEDQNDVVDLSRELPIEGLAGQLPPEEAERAKAMYQVYHKVFLRSSMSAETAI